MNEWTSFHETHQSRIELIAGVDCWIWTGSAHPGGHGRVASRTYGHNYAHRASYAAAYGSIPDGAIIRHMCGCGACVRPTHLMPGTHLQNSQDSIAMGRTHTHLTHDDVRAIRRLYDSNVPLSQIADRFSLAFGSVYPIVCYKAYDYIDPEKKGKHRRRRTNFIPDEKIRNARLAIMLGARNCDIARALQLREAAVSQIRTGARFSGRGEITKDDHQFLPVVADMLAGQFNPLTDRP